MKTCTKLFSLLLVSALTLGLTACTGDTKWAAEYDDQKVPAGVYVFNLLDAYGEASTLVEDTEADLLTQQVEGVDASEWIENRAKEFTNEYIAIERKAAELNLTLGTEETEYITYMVDQQWSYMGDIYTANGVVKSSVQQALENAIKRSLIFENTYGPEGTDPVPEDEILAFYQENFARCQYIALAKTAGGVALEGDALASVKEEMQGYIDRANSDEKFEDIIQAYRVTHTPEGQEAETDAYDSVLNKDSNSYPEAFRTQAFSAELNTPTAFEDDQYFYLLVRLDLVGDGTDLTNRRNSLISTLRLDEFLANVELWTADTTDVVYNEAALKKYTAAKVKVS